MPINFTSESWQAVTAWAETERQALRAMNDSDLSPEATATVRGQLKFIKKLLGLPAAEARARGAVSVDVDPFGGVGR